MKNISMYIWLLIAAFALNTPGAVMATPGSSVIATTDTLDKALNELAIEDGAIGNSLLEAIKGQREPEESTSIKEEATTTIAILTKMLKGIRWVASTAPNNIGGAIFMTCQEGDSAKRDDLVINSLHFGLHPDAPLFDNDSTLLHFAAYNGYVEMARAAINAGANLNIKNRNLVTALDIASAVGRYNENCRIIADLLKQHGAVCIGTRRPVDSNGG